MLLCSLQEKALRKLLFKMLFRFQNTILYGTGFGLIHTSAPLKPRSAIRGLLNAQPYSACFQLAFVSGQAQHNGRRAKYNTTHTHFNLCSCRSFLKHSISKPRPHLRAKPSLPMGVMAHFAWTLIKTFQDTVQSLPSAAPLWQPSVQLSSAPLQHNDFDSWPVTACLPSHSRSALFPGLFFVLAPATHLSGLQKSFFCLLLVSAKAPLCSALKSIFIVTHIPCPSQRNQNNPPQTKSITVGHSVYRDLCVTVTCLVSLPPSSPSVSSQPLSCLIFRFEFGLRLSFSSLLV